MSARFVADDGRRLAYADTGGPGPALLCLAGLTRNMADFEPVATHFAGRARVIRLDARGRGASDHDPDYRNYNLLREGQDVLALLDHLGLERAAILGTSRGGLVAMVLAMGHHARLSGVCLNDIGPVLEPAGLAHIMGYLGLRPDYADYEAAADGLAASMAARFAGVRRAQWRRHAERLWREGPGGLELRYDPALRRAVLEQGAGDGPGDLWPLFEALGGMPLALIRGENSDLLSAQTAAEMARRRPDMIYAQVPARGHVPFLDEPESLAAIAAFLGRLA